MSEACSFIERFYELGEVKEPNKIFCIKNSPKANAKTEIKNTKPDSVDYFNPENNAEVLDEIDKEEILNRHMARKYISIRYDFKHLYLRIVFKY